ncbi:methyl-accepting chemotaxis protein [Paramagnetospirillum caucaseum]|uniref:Methyl-accepting chemotaxis protein n=1 Tax=Paramagnetospirillum caucaseum TaxID=1244869 RepID=M2YF44_9PROT|nr:HD domain-containing phosphohydrolase [Paramagnetospirillum caucaseum]EME71581.1 methyl-accepting chemotaxis protein [Paramagnetospirillum caucaseum]
MAGQVRLGLQFSIVLIIAFVVVCLTVTTAGSIYFASTSAAREGARRLFGEITAKVADRVDGQIGDLLDLAGLGAALPAAGVPVSGDGAGHPLVPFMLRLLEQNSSLYAAYVGQMDGSFLQVIAARDDQRIRAAAGQAPDGTHFIIRAIATGENGKRRESWIFLDSAARSLGSAAKDDPAYDPRLRPWYKTAAVSASSVLSEPYVFSSLQAPGLTASRRAGSEGTVFGVDIALKGLSDFAAQQNVSPHGGVVLLDLKRRMLAAAPQLLAGAGKEPGALAELASVDAPMLRVLGEVTPGEAHLVASPAGEVLVQMTEWRHGSGQAIGIGLAAPFDDFTGPIQDMQARILNAAGLVLLVVVPLAMLFARRIARSVRHLVAEASRVREFDFSGTAPHASLITEFHDLSEAFGLMKQTIQGRTEDLAAAQKRLERVVDLGIAMSAERDHGVLMEMILMGAKELTNADGGTLYIRDADNNLRFQIIRNDTLSIRMGGAHEDPPSLPPVPMFRDGKPNHNNVVSHAVHEQATVNIPDAYDETRFDFSGTKAFDERNGYKSVSFMTVPLKPRGGDIIGAVQLINSRPHGGSAIVPFSPEIQRFVEALAAQAATALYNRDLLDQQERLMDAMIQIIAGAIDAKSPYTGGHCERVPELSLMLAEEACKVTEGPLAEFAFTTPDEWREFKIGAWLHDCGKVTTPEYVVDKATKLETIHNRIHEVRTRFEVLLRDERIRMLESMVAGTPADEAETMFEAAKAALLDDFAFIAECNLGGEFMAPEKVERLKAIATRTWMRHFDDRLGLAHEELRRYEGEPAPLPAVESLLSDKPQHVIPRPKDSALFDPAYGFKTKVPDNLYNFGEVYNLSVGRGTLSEEERFKINEHIIQTIIMLKRLPFPKHLSRVVEYAGTHHETLIGTGYPKKLAAEDLSIPARITAIADIFEALTASDRPYKKAKTLSECVKILSFFKKDKHVDPDLFDLFLTSGVYLRYAERFLKPEQIDAVEIDAYLG